MRQPGEVYGQRAIRRGRWKFLWDRGTDFLFDLSTDPGERRNLAFRDPGLVIELKKALAVWERQMPRVGLRVNSRLEAGSIATGWRWHQA